MTETGRRKTRVGTVVSAKMQKSIIVSVSWSTRYGVYRKSIARATRFMAHDEAGLARPGDVVRIEETRPLSNRKRWRLIEVIKKGDLAELRPEDIDLSASQGAEASK
ncbi:MAG: 30S ribosomal protein S17 [SAR202 cluster bacterium]|nr:30S ribosomal protein S17 [SAR202 cluster bacterium]